MDAHFYPVPGDNDDSLMNKEDVFERLRDSGADRAVVSYSGGHDEGDTESIELQRRTGETDELGEPVYERMAALREHIWTYVEDARGNFVYEPFQRPDGSTGSRRKQREITAEESAEMHLAQALAAPVYERERSFAGDFSVQGQVVWSVGDTPEDDAVVIQGQESFEQHEDFYEELY